MATAIIPTRNKFNIASRFLKLSRAMASERQTMGEADALHKDAEDRLSYFRNTRVRANSMIEDTSSDKDR